MIREFWMFWGVDCRTYNYDYYNRIQSSIGLDLVQISQRFVIYSIEYSQNTLFGCFYSFNLIRFSKDTEKWQPSLVEPTDSNCKDAAQWVSQLVANGNTCTLEALQVCLILQDLFSKDRLLSYLHHWWRVQYWRYRGGNSTTDGEIP